MRVIIIILKMLTAQQEIGGLVRCCFFWLLGSLGPMIKKLVYVQIKLTAKEGNIQPYMSYMLPFSSRPFEFTYITYMQMI